VIVRREAPGDRAGVFAVHAGAFARPGGEEAPEAGMVDELRRDGDLVEALTLVAVVGVETAGHVTCSRGHVDDRRLLALGPVAVAPAHQGRGVGHALLHAVLGGAEALGEPAVVLRGNPRFYRRFGFVPASPLGLFPSEHGGGDPFQVRPLTAWDASLRGAYRYAPAFERMGR
jgi:putative acetyltransferase